MILDDSCSLLTHLAFVIGRQADQILQERLGIGNSQYRILAVLNTDNNALIGQKDIASRLGQTEASISRQVKELVNRGYISIETNRLNRRKHEVTLTDKGARIVSAAMEVLRNLYDQSMSLLVDKQRVQLKTALNLMHETICASGNTAACDPLLRIWQMTDLGT